MKYLIIVLDLEASDAVLAWANEVATYFKDYRIIVTTHAYLGQRSALLTTIMGSSSVNSGQSVWDKFVSLHSNIQMMICGHSSGEDIIRTQLTGVNGNKVWNVMIDSSAHEFTGVTQPGLMALLKFSADGKTVTFNHYSMIQGEIFGGYNTFTINLGELLDVEVGGEEVEPTWPDTTDERQIVLMPNIQPFGVYASSTGLRNNTVGDSTTLQIAYNGVQFRDYWKAYAVSIDITADGIYKFDADAYINAKNGRIAVLQTSAKDGLTRIVPLTDPDDTDSITYANGLYGPSSSSGGSIMMTDILPNGIAVSAGDKITILFSGSTSYWGKMLFDGAVYDSEGNEIADHDLNMTSATIANNLYKAGYNGLMADGTASSYKNYKGFTAGWLHLTGSFANFFTQYTNTVTVNDESGNLLFKATSSSLGDMVGTQNKLPTLYKEGYVFLGYEVGGKLYAGGEYSVSGTTSASGTTQTVVAKFEKLPDAIMDTDGRVTVNLENVSGMIELPALTRAGQIFLGYAIDGQLYPAGTVYDKSSGATVVAVFADFAMVNGAAIRLDSPTGMRFQTYLDQSAYAYLSGNVTFGTLIAKADDISVNGVVDYSLLTTDAAITKLNVPGVTSKSNDKFFYFSGVLSTIKEHHYDWKFAARGYMVVTYADGSTQLFYANVTDNARSVAEVAEKALADVKSVKTDVYCNKVDGGYSVYSDEKRTVIEVFIKKEELQ